MPRFEPGPKPTEAEVAKLPQVNMVTIRMASDEWSSNRGGTMLPWLASDYFANHPDIDPLVVEVVEHGGWHQSFLRDGTCVGTANDQAVLSKTAYDFLGKHYYSPRRYVEMVRRDEITRCDRLRYRLKLLGDGGNLGLTDRWELTLPKGYTLNELGSMGDQPQNWIRFDDLDIAAKLIEAMECKSLRASAA